MLSLSLSCFACIVAKCLCIYLYIRIHSLYVSWHCLRFPARCCRAWVGATAETWDPWLWACESVWTYLLLHGAYILHHMSEVLQKKTYDTLRTYIYIIVLYCDVARLILLPPYSYLRHCNVAVWLSYWNVLLVCSINGWLPKVQQGMQKHK